MAMGAEVCPGSVYNPGDVQHGNVHGTMVAENYS